MTGADYDRLVAVVDAGYNLGLTLARWQRLSDKEGPIAKALWSTALGGLQAVAEAVREASE